MFKKNTDEPTKLQLVIDEMLDALLKSKEGSNEYTTLVDQLTKLYKLKEIDLPKRISPETWATVGGSLAGILLIIGHERIHVIATKALGFVMKTR